jgi:hypothetical protein
MAEINASDIGRVDSLGGSGLVIACPRCMRANSELEVRCTSCGLLLDAALRAQIKAEADAAQDRRPTGDLDSTDGAERETAADESAQQQVRDAQHETLAQVLGIEVEHVCALADAGIHTLEHVAESIPEQIAHALGVWTHIDPAALIARARAVLHRAPLPEAEPQKLADEPDPAQWWKMT